MRHIDSLVDLVYVTSPAKWQPSAAVMVRSIASVWALLGQQVSCRIYADQPQSYIDDDAREAYREYLKELRRLRVGEITYAKSWRRYSGQLRRISGNIHKPLVLLMEHDWAFRDPDNIDVDGIVATMLNPSSGVRVIRFCKTKHALKNIGARRLQHSPLGILRLTLAGYWQTQPHIATREFYGQVLNRQLRRWRDKGDGRLKRLQSRLKRNFQRRARHHGQWNVAIREGIYYYGVAGRQRDILHLGDRYPRGKPIAQGPVAAEGERHEDLGDNSGLQSGTLSGGDD